MLFAGIDVGGTSVKWCLVDEAGQLVREGSIKTIIADPQALADAIAQTLKATGLSFAAAGVSCAGRVNKETNTIIASNLRWRHVPFQSMLQASLGCPVTIDNDVAGALMGEWAQGACRNEKHAAYLTLGTGVGGAFLIDGKPFRGYNNTGGEIGHMVIHGDGLPCTCGGKGCFEQYASATALARMAGGVDAKEVFARAADGDEAMAAVLDQYAHELAIGLANIIGVFRPRMIVLGGGVAGAGDALLSRVEDQLRNHCPSMPGQELPKLVTAALGNKAGMIGGAMMGKALWENLNA